jgi:dihydrofolate reductase
MYPETAHPRVTIVAAMTIPGRVIGHKGEIPWHLPSELRHFAQATTGGCLVMGPNTFRSIMKPRNGTLLGNNRTMMVLTHQQDWHHEGVEVVHSPKEAEARTLKLQKADLYVIGGRGVYETFLPLAHCMIMTLVTADVEGDTLFPEYATGDWEQVGTADSWKQYVGEPYSYQVRKYIRASEPK